MQTFSLRSARGRIGMTAAASALVVGLASTAPASALPVNVEDDESVTVDLSGSDTGAAIDDALTALGDVAKEALQNSAPAPSEATDENVRVIVTDPREFEEAQIGDEFSDIEDYLDSLLGPDNVGETADGRTVIFPSQGAFTSGFGARGDSVHEGIDIANSIGTPIDAVMDGTVVEAGPASGYGNWVVLEHADGERSIYGHMDTINVSTGQQVSAGDQIAEIGNEGRSTGPHLHFEILPDGTNPADPVTWFAQQDVSVNSARQ